MKGLFSRQRWSVLFVCKVVLTVIPIIILLSIVNRRTILFSSVTTTYRPGQAYNFISFGAGQVVKTTDDPPYAWAMYSDSLNLHVWLPRAIPAVRVQADIATSDAEYISWTAKGTTAFGDTTTLVWSAALNTLTWNRTKDHGLTFWQRPNTAEHSVRQYASLAEFQQQVPDMSRLAVVGVDPYSFVEPPNYQPSLTALRLPVAVRGKQILYVYAAHEDLHLTFKKVDRNVLHGPDSLSIRVARADQVQDKKWLYNKVLPDDGNTSTNGHPGQPQLADILLRNVTPGMYRIELDCGADIMIEDMTSLQHILGFAKSLYMAAGPAYRGYIADTSFPSVSVTTNSAQIQIAADHVQGQQVVQIGGKKITLNQPKTGTPVALSGKTTQFSVAKPDIQLTTGNGLFSVGPFTLPAQGATELSLYPAPIFDQYDYILSTYVPQVADDHITIDQTYQQADLAVDGKKQLSFTLNVPGLRAQGFHVGPKKFTVTYTHGNIPWARFWHRLEKALGFSQ